MEDTSKTTIKDQMVRDFKNILKEILKNLLLEQGLDKNQDEMGWNDEHLHRFKVKNPNTGF